MTELFYIRAATAGRLRTALAALVVPVVALQECVLHAINSKVPEYIPLATLAEQPRAWDGKPVVLGHPEANGRQISANHPRVLEAHGLGTIQHTRVENRKLMMDLFLDTEKAERLGAHRLLERLRNGEQVEVSVGAFVQTTPTSGIHNGKPYAAIWRTLTPDHIAVLEHTKGACSCEDGCGTYQRAAEQYAPLDAYAPALALRSAAEATPESTFAERDKAERRRAFAEEYAAWDAAPAPKPPDAPRAEDLTAFAPPDPYERDLAAMKENK